MVWRRLFHRDPDPNDDSTPAEAKSHSAQPETNPLVARDGRVLPPHFRQPPSTPRPPRPPQDPEARLATLRQRRAAALYDVEQGQIAQQEDNPWRDRISLLNEALETVQTDRNAAEHVEPGPWHPVDPVPISDIVVDVADNLTSVALTVGDIAFAWEEPRDWRERSNIVIRGDLLRTAGDVDPLLPSGVPEHLREPLHQHLDAALFSLATDLRERALEREDRPDVRTLADLAGPCPVCGGWADHLGRCQTCARRAARLQELARERDRLLGERAGEMEEERRVVERLPVAMRRLADVEREIAALEPDSGR